MRSQLHSTNWLLSTSILSADMTQMGAELADLEAGGADWVHVDVMDGHFIPNLTMVPIIVAACRRSTRLPIDVHLMVSQPDPLLESFARAGANWLTVHVETCPHLHRTLQAIRAIGCRPGVALNPGTPVEAVGTVLELVDLVLVLGTNPGFSGQKWIPGMAKKIVRLREMLDLINPSALIQVDGGITMETLPEAYRSGASVFVAGNAVFKHPEGIKRGIEALRSVKIQNQ